MHFTKFFSAALPSLLFFFFFFFSTTTAHMEMVTPYAIRSKHNPANTAGGSGQVDYSMTSPLESSGSNFACKGYQNDRPIKTVATYKAGSQQKLSLTGSATHDGGSCQIALSYDNGKTFRVIKSMIGGCPIKKDYDFTVPTYAPSGTALLSWSWQNKVGNREFYQNCAWVQIDGGSSAPSKRSTGHERRMNGLIPRDGGFSKFDDLPYIWRANMPQATQCKTTEGEEPVYPHPGPDVEYGGGKSKSDPPSPGNDCDAASPPPPTYKDMPTSGAQSRGGSGSGGGSSGGGGGGDGASSGSAGSYSGGGGSSSSPSSSDSSSSSGGASGSSSQTQPSQPATSAPYPAQQQSQSSQPQQQPAPASNPVAPQLSPSPGGSCTPGAMKCPTPQSWSQCVSGGTWTDMGAVPAGMTCSGGNIVAQNPQAPGAPMGATGSNPLGGGGQRKRGLGGLGVVGRA